MIAVAVASPSSQLGHTVNNHTIGKLLYICAQFTKLPNSGADPVHLLHPKLAGISNHGGAAGHRCGQGNRRNLINNPGDEVAPDVSPLERARFDKEIGYRLPPLQSLVLYFEASAHRLQYLNDTTSGRIRSRAHYAYSGIRMNRPGHQPERCRTDVAGDSQRERG
ncbi:MAG: hypothetical protein DDT28_01190 [Dehalococcoidia bacterium]|nr:hypothetical protein [Chloroflexota bacterium]